ncbi:MAG: DNA polymerase III subunit delta' [Campylobacterota bacterium]|nr:DNA polymerase III subunit delta' [Campylobacterota bacterium]
MSSLKSHILISQNIQESVLEYQELLKGHRVVPFVQDDFKVEDSRAVIAEAYISEDKTKYIILAAKSFNNVSQNALLKALEEPPRNIEFILISPSKSIFLPTIRSRLPMKIKQSQKTIINVDINLNKLDLAHLFNFVKAHERTKKHDAKLLIEALYFQGSVNESIMFNQVQLNAFETAYRLIDLNGRFNVVLTMLLMTFLPKRDNVNY